MDLMAAKLLIEWLRERGAIRVEIPGVVTVEFVRPDTREYDEIMQQRVEALADLVEKASGFSKG